MTTYPDSASGQPVQYRLVLDASLRVLNAQLAAVIDRSLAEVGADGGEEWEGAVCGEVVRSVEVRE